MVIWAVVETSLGSLYCSLLLLLRLPLVPPAIEASHSPFVESEALGSSLGLATAPPEIEVLSRSPTRGARSERLGVDRPCAGSRPANAGPDSVGRRLPGVMC